MDSDLSTSRCPRCQRAQVHVESHAHDAEHGLDWFDDCNAVEIGLSWLSFSMGQLSASVKRRLI